MSKLKELTDVWKNIREFDLRPLREAALQPLKIVIVGASGSGRHTLLEQMHRDAIRAQADTATPVVIATPEDADLPAAADLFILVLDVTRESYDAERTLTRRWSEHGQKVLVFVNKCDTLGEGAQVNDWAGSNLARVVYGSAQERSALLERFVPAVLALLPDQLLALGRQFPLFREAIARQLIDDTCIANAAYAFSTALAAVVPVLDLPFNVADMVVLTKAQAFLAYKLGLALGFSIHWQDYVAEFGSVIGSGFIWRQIARQLVGLIPVWGIIPKVGVAYAGTFVVGQVVLQWYRTGRHVSKEQMRQLYLEAFDRGKEIAQGLLTKLPRLGRKHPKGAALPEGNLSPSKPPRPKRGAPKKKAPLPGRLCPTCHKESAADAHFCQYCGQPFEEEARQV